MDTSGYELSDMDNLECFLGNPHSDADAVFVNEIDTPFSTTAFDSLEMGGSVGNPTLLVNEEDKEKSPHNSSL